MKTTIDTWTPTDETFGTRLAMIRQRMGWNAKEAALECGISQNNWLNWETGRSPRDLFEVSKKISKRTGVDLAWLVMGSKPGLSDYKAQVSVPRSRPPRGPVNTIPKLTRPRARA